MAKRRELTPEVRNVVYQPPEASTILQFSSEVCKDLGETLDPDFDTPEIRSELANFIRIVAEICTDQANKKRGGT